MSGRDTSQDRSPVWHPFTQHALQPDAIEVAGAEGAWLEAADGRLTLLAQGAWAPVVFIMIVAAFVWSQIAPSACDCLTIVRVPNFWWQLGGVGLLGATALFCGWLQGVFGWHPPELSLEPPAPVHDHHHGHAHH